MTIQSMTDRGLLALIRHEGIVPGPYLDARGTWTFGIGHTAVAGPPDPATLPRGMPQARAFEGVDRAGELSGRRVGGRYRAQT